jgi:hypothetical protein
MKPGDDHDVTSLFLLFQVYFALIIRWGTGKMQGRLFLPTTKTENQKENILHNHVRHLQDDRIRVPARFGQCPETPEQGIQGDRKTVL